MPVTGDIWISLSLAQLVPELDPNNPGAAASMIRDKINEVEGRLQQTLSSVNDVIAASSALLAQAGTVANALQGAQAAINELANNAGNTGVYFRLLGICPDFPNSLLKNSQELSNEIYRVMLQGNGGAQRTALKTRLADAIIKQQNAEAVLAGTATPAAKEQAAADAQAAQQEIQQVRAELTILDQNTDPCTPEFVGDTAYIGGLVLVVGAPDPRILWDKLKVIAEIWPGLKDVVKDAEGQFKGIAESAEEFLDKFKPQRLSEIAQDFRDFKKRLEALGEDPFFNKDKLLVTNGCDKWACARLKDIMPALDPNVPGSPLNIVTETTQGITDSLASTLNRVAGLQNTAAKLMGEISELQSNINNFKNSVFEFADNLAATGVYVHAIGRDGTLHNNNDFAAAASAAVFDAADPGRPTFRGETAVVAGFLMVIGAPNVEGLTNDFDNLSKAITGFGGKWKEVKNAADRAVDSAKSLKDAASTSETDPAFQMNPTSAIKGGTDSTLLKGLGL